MTPHRLDWRKDPRDERDALRGRAALALPPSVDHAPCAPEVDDQGKEGSCTGWSTEEYFTGTAIQQGVYPGEHFSADWFYSLARMYEGCLQYDDGAFLRDTFRGAYEYGCLLEHFRPYSDACDTTSPLTWMFAGESVLAFASDWPAGRPERCVDGVDGICAALAAGHFVSIGTPWYASWEETDAQGQLSENHLEVVGGHAYLVVGYDTAKGLLKCLNSWGPAWGLKGFFYVPFSAVTAWKRDGGYDAWTAPVDWKNGPVPPPIEPEPKLPVTALAIGALVIASIVLAIKACG